MFKKVTSKPLFPTYIWSFDLEDEISAGLNVDLMKGLDALTPERPKLEPGRKWQTDQNLHEFEEFAEHDAERFVDGRIVLQGEALARTFRFAGIERTHQGHFALALHGHDHPMTPASEIELHRVEVFVIDSRL